MDNLHPEQMSILRELSFRGEANFSTLNVNGVSNDHFSYHLRSLIKAGLLDKSEELYKLTNEGKKFISHMDTNTRKIEKLPKVSVLVIPQRGEGESREFLVQTRRKEPYFGYSGFMTGKLRYGETITEGAQRELQEEVGLAANKVQHLFVLHEMVYDMEGNQLEDKFFNAVLATDFSGELQERTEEGENRWVTEAEFRTLPNLFHNEIDMLNWYLEGFRGFREEKYTIKGF
jgi:8-oxo-dGTP diphosphatase